ncbi:hypothetical protein EVAR_37444_1 [Eumeta japonica]|uniref:Uncharacterized protein n=1 Tax=Eumeta variegata TaxID=151549 RepID=A0A4C1X436_EUMVA|nr:hypothetical protein EVAR_37444_1 [Eumeta japonica]
MIYERRSTCELAASPRRRASAPCLCATYLSTVVFSRFFSGFHGDRPVSCSSPGPAAELLRKQFCPSGGSDVTDSLRAFFNLREINEDSSFSISFRVCVLGLL